MSSTIRVVAAILLNDDHRFLIARKRPGKSLAGFWEFPGGKVEDGEEDVNALEREIKEELNVQLRDIYFCFTYLYSYPTQTIEFLFFTARIKQGTLTLTDHDAMAWIKLDDQIEYNIAPGDLPAFDLLKKHPPTG